jgi:tetratricopeptide (TPR) repeat protein
MVESNNTNTLNQLHGPNCGRRANNLATFYRATGRPAEAEPLYQRALAIWEQTLGPDHPHLLQARETYAGLLDQLGRHAEATELRAQAQASRSRRAPELSHRAPEGPTLEVL